MSKILRHRTVQIGGEGGETIRLKKWSAGKLFHLVRDFWGLIEEALTGLDLEKLTEFQLITNIIEVLLKQEHRAAQLVKWSVDDPRGLTEDQILDWDADAFLGVLNEVVEMNVTEELVKNFQRLLATATEKFGSKKPGSSSKTPAESQAVSSP